MTDDANKNLLRELVERMVEELLDEATHRKDYVNDLRNVMRGAMGEYLKARYVETNGFPYHPERIHWDKEVDEHFMFRFDVIVKTKTKGRFEPRKAFLEALDDVRSSAHSYLKWAKRKVAEIPQFMLDEKTMEDPPDEALDEFYARCWNEFEQRIHG